MISSEPSPTPIRTRRGRWWHESEILLLMAVVLAAYFLRAGDLTIRGEESRWATTAREMIRSGDWVVPRQQGEPFLSRPPVGPWLIALVTLVRGQCDVWAIRLPTVTAVLLTTLLIYAFGRSFLNRVGALTAGLAYCTMGEVLQMGRVAESDLVFSCLLSSAAIVWLWGERSGWPAWIMWCGGYSLAALAALAKGPQAPVYFAGAVAIYLALRRDWRTLFSKWHALGLVTFVLIAGGWQAAFVWRTSWAESVQLWTADSVARFEHLSVGDVLKHLATYPLEVLGCTAPWSLFLAAYLSRRFRAGLTTERPYVLFLTIYFVLGFLPCWATPGGMTRYCLPLYPALALLIGVAAMRVADATLSTRLQWAWTNGWRLCAGTIIVLAVAVAVISFTPVPSLIRPWAQPVGMCVVFTIGALGAALCARRTALSCDRRQIRTATIALAGFMTLTYAGVIVSALVQRSADAPAAMAALRRTLPADARLVSLNGVHHLFAYLYADPIELRSWPADEDKPFEWFCFSTIGDYRVPLPFSWEEVAVIPMDRNFHAKLENVVVVGRRLDGAVADRR